MFLYLKSSHGLKGCYLMTSCAVGQIHSSGLNAIRSTVQEVIADQEAVVIVNVLEIKINKSTSELKTSKTIRVRKIITTLLPSYL